MTRPARRRQCFTAGGLSLLIWGLLGGEHFGTRRRSFPSTLARCQDGSCSSHATRGGSRFKALNANLLRLTGGCSNAPQDVSIDDDVEGEGVGKEVAARGRSNVDGHGSENSNGEQVVGVGKDGVGHVRGSGDDDGDDEMVPVTSQRTLKRLNEILSRVNVSGYTPQNPESGEFASIEGGVAHPNWSNQASLFRNDGGGNSLKQQQASKDTPTPPEINDQRRWCLLYEPLAARYGIMAPTVQKAASPQRPLLKHGDKDMEKLWNAVGESDSDIATSADREDSEIGEGGDGDGDDGASHRGGREADGAPRVVQSKRERKSRRRTVPPKLFQGPENRREDDPVIMPGDEGDSTRLNLGLEGIAEAFNTQFKINKSVLTRDPMMKRTTAEDQTPSAALGREMGGKYEKPANSMDILAASMGNGGGTDQDEVAHEEEGGGAKAADRGKKPLARKERL
eukprot:jgi/Bigna1/72701/fgenesh1_pg.21_\